jgi:hypothetical protein
MMNLPLRLFVLIALVAPFQLAAASIVSYGFEGTFYTSNIPDIAVGTPFSGRLTYDTNAPVSNSGTNYIDYLTGTLDMRIGSSFLHTSGGLFDLRLAHNVFVGLPTGGYPNRDLLEFSDYVGVVATGPLAADGLASVLIDIVYPLNTLGNLTLPANTPTNLDASYIAIFDFGQGVVHGSFSSTVPEPASIALVGVGFLAMLGRRRTLFRSL